MIKRIEFNVNRLRRWNSIYDDLLFVIKNHYCKSRITELKLCINVQQKRVVTEIDYDENLKEFLYLYGNFNF